MKVRLKLRPLCFSPPAGQPSSDAICSHVSPAPAGQPSSRSFFLLHIRPHAAVLPSPPRRAGLPPSSPAVPHSPRPHQSRGIRPHAAAALPTSSLFPSRRAGQPRPCSPPPNLTSWIRDPPHRMSQLHLQSPESAPPSPSSSAVKTLCFSFYFYCIENYQYKVVLTNTNNAK
jgi:hypothetical protein